MCAPAAHPYPITPTFNGFMARITVTKRAQQVKDEGEIVGGPEQHGTERARVRQYHAQQVMAEHCES